MSFIAAIVALVVMAIGPVSTGSPRCPEAGTCHKVPSTVHHTVKHRHVLDK